MNNDMIIWLGISKALFRDIIPGELVEEALNGGLSPAEYAFLVHREELRVDSALLTMSRAADRPAALEIGKGLPDDTLIALASRWGHYATAWKKQGQDPNHRQWLPLDNRAWRVILLTMVQESEAQMLALSLLLQEVSPVPTSAT
jgi:hypothetical protein